MCFFFFFSSRRRHTRLTCDWSSDVCSSDLHPSDVASRPTTEGDEVISVSGGDVIMRSVLIDAISQVSTCGGSAVAPGAMADEMADSRPPASAREIAQLANAWARLNAGTVEEEKLKLRTESKLEMAFKELSKDVRSDPEARELFQKLYAVVKRLEEEKAKKMGRN